jgi:Bacterial PH domain
MAIMTDSARVTIRLPLTALLGVFGLIVCMTPVAFGAPGLQVLYLVPLSLGYWVIRNRTVVSADAVVAHRVWGSQRMAWSELAGLRVDDQSRIWAVLHGGDEVGLPAVRARHLPVLAALSGGRLPATFSGAGEQPTARG